MKLLGLIGGVSPESTELYYRLLNRHARDRLGGNHSAKLMISSFDFAEMVDPYEAQDWPRFIDVAVKSAERLKAAGVDGVIICSNTTHKAADAVRAAINLPLIHLLDVLGAEIKAQNSKKPLLLGTPETMNGDFYRPYLLDHHDIDCLVPNADDQHLVDRIIFDELCNGEVKETSRQAYIDIIERNRALGADGVILGCTEIALLIEQQHTNLSVFDTTRLHAAAASRFQFDEAS